MNNGGYYGHQAKFFKQPFKDNSLQQLTTRRIVALEAFWRKNPTTKAKANMATGILLNNQLVLTAGHNVYNNDFRQIASDLKISFLDEGNYEISSKNISMLIKPRLNENIYLQLKSNNQEEGYLIDLALIKLKRIQEIPNNINILGFKISISDKSLVEKNDKYHGFQQVDEVIVCGFPDKKTLKNNNNKKHDRNKEQEVVAQLKILTGKLSQITQRNIYYRQIKTVLGQSGAPIFTYQRNSYHLVGIHTQFNQVIDTGRGIILTDQLIIKIKRWASLLKANLQLNQNYIQNRNYRVLDGPNKSIASLSTSQSLSHSFENVLKQFQQATTFKLAHLQNSIAEVKKHLETIGIDQLSTSICLYKFNQFKSKWQQTKIKGWIAQSKDCSTDLVRIDNLIQQIVGKIDMMYAQEKLSSSSLYAQQQQQDWAFYDKHRGQFQSNFTDISQLILNNTKEKRHQTMFDT